MVAHRAPVAPAGGGPPDVASRAGGFPPTPSRARAGRLTLVPIFLTFLFIANPLPAQWQKPGEPEVLGPDARRSESAFQLFADRDLAGSGFRMSAEFSGCTDNSGNITTNRQCWNNSHPSPRFMPDWFDMFFYVAAPPSERNKHAELVPSLLNANNKGYTVNSVLSQYRGELLPGDGTLGPFHSGVTDSGAGDCTDHREVPTGNVLLAASGCRQTWGWWGWSGSRPVDEEGYLAYADRVGDLGFSFDPWRVPEDLHDNESYLGEFQTYGFFSDYGVETLYGSESHPSYGNVIPGGVGDPTRSGWPLGVYAKMDVFTFSSYYDLRNVAFYQITLTNNSRAVYGVPLAYDSLYMGLQPGVLQFNGGQSMYRDPANGVIRIASMCQGFTNSSSQGVSGNGCGPGGDPMHPASSWGTAPPEGVGAGFNYGAAAIVTLKSPIGDLRNKHFTDPESPFFGKGDPQSWDDTITFNHGHMCGFHGCSAVTWNAPASTAMNADYEQRQFGMVSSITRDVLGNRAVGDISLHTMWDTWRWEEYPDKNFLDFNKWVPGFWDYNEDGIPDTLHYDDCSDNSGPQYDPFTGNEKRCSIAWTDTLPGGFGNAYCNRGAVTGAGPFALPAGSTVQFVFAIVMASNLYDIESAIRFTVHNYMTFSGAARPQAAPAPRIVSFDIDADRDTTGEPAARGTLYMDDAAEVWEDPLLQSWFEYLQTAPPGSQVANLTALNPFLEDTVESLIANNVAAVHVFKSCDGGATYTADSDCRGDPARDGKFAEIGWYPYLTIPARSNGDISDTFVADSLFTGQGYLFSLVTETRGLTVPVINGEADTTFTAGGDTVIACVAECRNQNLTIASALFSTLASDPAEPHVVSIYAAVSRQSGSTPARFEVAEPSPDFIPVERMGLTAASDTVVDGEYRLLFADTVTVTEYWWLTEDGEELEETVVRAVDAGGDPLTFTVPGAVGVDDAYTDTIIGDQRIRVYPFSRNHDYCGWGRRLVAVLVNADETPLLVTRQLGGGQSVPSRFFGLPNFPGFTVSIDNGLCGTLEEQSYVDANGVLLAPAAEPSVTFVPSLSRTRHGNGGRYRLTWYDAAFGPGSPFPFDPAEPEAVRQSVLASLAARAVAWTASTEPGLGDSIGVNPSDMLAVDLPFLIEDVTDPDNPAPLRVVVPGREKQTSLTLGVGPDTVNVAVPDTVWLPGDGLFVVAGGDTLLEEKFRYAVIACDPAYWPTPACNPVATDGPGVAGYVETLVGQQIRFSYYQRIASETDYVFTAHSALAGKELMRSEPASIAASLDSVKVVPNPFVVFSRYDQGGSRPFLLFTHVPPRGRLHVYTVSGQFVQLVRWGPNDLNGQGDLRFYPLTRENREMAAGLYLYVLEAKDEAGNSIGVKKGKFVLIR